MRGWRRYVVLTDLRQVLSRGFYAHLTQNVSLIHTLGLHLPAPVLKKVRVCVCVGPCTWLSTGHCWRRGDEARVRAVGPSVCSLFSNTRRRRIGRSGERVARAETAAAVTAKTRTLIVAAKTGASTLSENPMYSCAWKGRK